MVGSLPNLCLWIGTANNPRASSEIGRRVLPVGLDSGLEHPELRTGFKHAPLRAWVQAHRGDLVWSALVLIQRWIAQGQPVGAAMLGSFEAWAAALSGVLDGVGLPGLLVNQARFREATDLDRGEVREFFRLWWGTYGADERTVGGATGIFTLLRGENAPDLPGLTAPTEDGRRKQLGKGVLPALKGRPVTIGEVLGETVTVVLERVGTDAHTKTNTWRLLRQETPQTPQTPRREPMRPPEP
jgi:hypothetical protein